MFAFTNLNTKEFYSANTVWDGQYTGTAGDPDSEDFSFEYSISRGKTGSSSVTITGLKPGVMRGTATSRTILMPYMLSMLLLRLKNRGMFQAPITGCKILAGTLAGQGIGTIPKPWPDYHTT